MDVSFPTPSSRVAVQPLPGTPGRSALPALLIPGTKHTALPQHRVRARSHPDTSPPPR